MYSIFARVAFGTLSAVAISAFSPVFAEVDDDEVDLVVKLGKPLVFGAEQHVSSSKNAPPIARAAPVTDVIVMPDHLADVQEKLCDHPSQRLRRARRRAMEGVRPKGKPRAPIVPRRQPT